MSHVYDIENSPEIKSVEECEGVQTVVSEALERHPEVTRVVSTIRHPGLTYSSRLVVGDVVGNVLVAQLKNRANGSTEHDNLIWEANVPNSPNATRFDWRLLRAAGKDVENWTFPNAVIPWFRPATPAMKETFAGMIGNDERFSQVATDYAEVTGIPVSVIGQRMAVIRSLYQENYVADGTEVPMSIASQRIYDALLEKVLGSEFSTNTPHTPFMVAAKDIVLPQLTAIGAAEFQNIVSRRYPNGVKTLFYGYPVGEDAEDVVGYVGYSPKGVFLATMDRVSDGKVRGKGKEISAEQVFELVAAERLIPIGVTPMIVMYQDATRLCHGADHGTFEQMSQYISCQSGMLKEPHDSWSFLKIDMGNGVVAEPSLQELYLLFGEKNPILRQIVLASLHRAEPVVVEIDKLKQMVSHG